MFQLSEAIVSSVVAKGLVASRRTEKCHLFKVCCSRNFQTLSYEALKVNKPPSSEHVNNPKEKPELAKSIGAFQKLPLVMPSTDILQSALRKARRVRPTQGITNIAKRERNKGSKQLDTLMKELAVPLREYVERFPKKQSLHPYEKALLELTLGEGNYESVLFQVDFLRKRVVSVGKERASLCGKSSTKREAEDRLREGVEAVERAFAKDGFAVDELLSIAKTLRGMPVVDLETPTLCLVGAPNVGKSSLVRILSSGKPEVCNYPFTTRGILMGHMGSSTNRFQVTDTPGLLNRDDEERNNLEKLTLAVLSHLPTAILYVHDLTGECGTSPSDQFAIYAGLKQRFKDHLWIDVFSKCDILTSSHFEKYADCGALRVSVKTEEGLSELKATVDCVLNAQRNRIIATS